MKNGNSKFADPGKESAVIGYLAVQGCHHIPDSYWVSPDDFTDPRWRLTYVCADNLRRAGREVNHLTISDEIERLNWDSKLEKEIGGAGWQSWFAFCDHTLESNHRSAIDSLKEIRRLAAERQKHTVLEHADELTLDQTIEQLLAIKEASQEQSLSALLESRRFDSAKALEVPRPIYQVNHQTLCTPGNITAISSHIKSGKSAFVGACIAATTGRDGDTLGVNSANPHGHAVIHFDTEQSPYDHGALIRTALSRVGMTDNPNWLRSYPILDIPTSQRFELLEHEMRDAKRAHHGIHSVLLDGSADYVKDPNNPDEAFAAVERFHGLAVQYATTILCVIHINPGSENGKTRGHLGSQLARKAESNIELSKDAHEITTVYTSSARHAFISKQDGPRFQWDSAESMHLSCGTEREEKTTAIAVRLKCVAEEVFENPQRYSEALTGIMKVAKVKERQGESLFSDIHKAGLIAKNLIGQWELTT